jgi:hypothetical protein
MPNTTPVALQLVHCVKMLRAVGSSPLVVKTRLSDDK